MKTVLALEREHHLEGSGGPKIGVFSIESKDWIDLGQLSDLKKVFKDI